MSIYPVRSAGGQEYLNIRGVAPRRGQAGGKMGVMELGLCIRDVSMLMHGSWRLECDLTLGQKQKGKWPVPQLMQKEMI